MNPINNTNCTSSTPENLAFYISFFNISEKEFRNIFVNKKYCRKLAKILGSLDCVEFFKEIYFFCTAETGGILLDGRRYVYNSFKAWADQLDNIRCDRTLQNYAKKLLEVGLVKIERLRKHEFNHTNYYSVNFEKLFELIEFKPKQKDKKKQKQKSGKYNRQSSAEAYTTDIDGNTVARSNVDALNLNISALDNEKPSQPITKSLHCDLNTINTSITRDHLLEGDRKKLSQPAEEMMIKNQDSTIEQLVSNEMPEPALNDLETNGIGNELENINDPGLLADTSNFEGVTETTTEMPGEDQSSGACSTDENNASHKVKEPPIKVNKPEAGNEKARPTAEQAKKRNILNNSQLNQSSSETKKAVNEMTLDLGIEFMFPQQKTPKPVTQDEIKKRLQPNKWSKPILQGFVRRMSDLKMTINPEVIKFMLNHDYSQVEIALTDLEHNSAVIRNFDAVFKTAVINAVPEFLGARNVYDSEQRERDRKFEEQVMQPEVVEERSLALQNCKKIAQQNKGIHLKKIHKNHPLASAAKEVELMQENALTSSEAYISNASSEVQ